MFGIEQRRFTLGVKNGSRAGHVCRESRAPTADKQSEVRTPSFTERTSRTGGRRGPFFRRVVCPEQVEEAPTVVTLAAATDGREQQSCGLHQPLTLAALLSGWPCSRSISGRHSSARQQFWVPPLAIRWAEKSRGSSSSSSSGDWR